MPFICNLKSICHFHLQSLFLLTFKITEYYNLKQHLLKTSFSALYFLSICVKCQLHEFVYVLYSLLFWSTCLFLCLFCLFFFSWEINRNILALIFGCFPIFNIYIWDNESFSFMYCELNPKPLH